jgi:epoxyqueuosine reductase
MPSELTHEVKRFARSLGFARVGVANAECSALEADGRYFRAWLEAGYHGSMSHLERSVEVRCNPAHPSMLADVKSVLVLAASYAQQDRENTGAKGRFARYARGRDYHNILYKRVKKIAALLRQYGFRSRCSVDSMPVLERAWARKAGLGFIGKNCCLIVPGLGSYVFLATVLTTAELVPDEPIKRDCGQCEICLKHCPTGALLSEYLLDARRCISYLTGVHRGPIPSEFRSRIGDRMLGCDACQEACPYNFSENNDRDTSSVLLTDCAWKEFDADAVLQMDDATFTQNARATVMRKTGRESMARNAAIVLGNSADSKYRDILLKVARTDPSQVVRDAAAWAVRNLSHEKLEAR